MRRNDCAGMCRKGSGKMLPRGRGGNLGPLTAQPGGCGKKSGEVGVPWISQAPGRGCPRPLWCSWSCPWYPEQPMIYVSTWSATGPGGEIGFPREPSVSDISSWPAENPSAISAGTTLKLPPPSTPPSPSINSFGWKRRVFHCRIGEDPEFS
jgi:hypothetical protein